MYVNKKLLIYLLFPFGSKNLGQGKSLTQGCGRGVLGEVDWLNWPPKAKEESQPTHRHPGPDTQGPCLQVFLNFIIKVSCKLGVDFVLCHLIKKTEKGLLRNFHISL